MQNCRFALLRSNFQTLPPTLFFIYQERTTQLVLCHTLTDTLSRTIHNHCGQLPSCSYLTVSVWCSLYGISGCSGKENLRGNGEWLVFHVFQHVFPEFAFSSYSVFCSVFNVTFICICTELVYKQRRQ